ncbi:MAG: hypothetical protein KBC00_02345 [Candidatus Levybacteria bacterium]|nr:hypothetical protein [Candidatus Levybacteria bacterium]MBP9815415.1 hypothetical protein [Candidatus Levybacteria bacterium]
MSLESNQPDRFTDDDRRALAKKFHSPPYESTSDHANSYIKMHYKKEDQEKIYGDDRDWIRFKDIGEVITTGIYIENFLEECFRNSNDFPTPKKGKLALDYFHNWKKNRQEDYLTLNTDESILAADIIGSLTIYDVCRYTNSKIEAYENITKNPSIKDHDKDFYEQKSAIWGNYSKVLVEATKRHSRLRQ